MSGAATKASLRPSQPRRTPHVWPAYEIEARRDKVRKVRQIKKKRIG
jgi:hypothetical protein